MGNDVDFYSLDKEQFLVCSAIIFDTKRMLSNPILKNYFIDKKTKQFVIVFNRDVVDAFKEIIIRNIKKNKSFLVVFYSKINWSENILHLRFKK